MTDKPDTSTEAVEPMADFMDDLDYELEAATLRALLAERDALAGQVAASEAKLVAVIEARDAAKAERDALIPALPPAPSDTRGWSGMGAATCTGKPALTLEQRVAALEERMRNR